MFRILTMSILLLTSNIANAKVIVNETKTTYKVSGTTGIAIMRNIRKKNNSLNIIKSHEIARVNYNINVTNIKKSIMGNVCKILDADIIINANYILPNWIDSEKSSINMNSEWNIFMDYVLRHEKTHVDIATQFAEKYLMFLKSITYPSLTDCLYMDEGDKKILNMMIKENKKRQNIFDFKESHLNGRARKAQNRLLRAK